MSPKAKLIEKILAMIDGATTEHERDTAKEIYKKILAKYDLEEPQEKENHFFDFKMKAKSIMIQCIAMQIGDVDIYDVQGFKTKLAAYCTEADSAIIRSLYDFYSKKYLEDLEIFDRAFVEKNNLYSSKIASVDDLSEEDLIKLRKARLMSESMDSHHYRKQLTGGAK